MITEKASLVCRQNVKQLLGLLSFSFLILLFYTRLLTDDNTSSQYQESLYC